MSSIQTLNEKFGINSAITFCEGPGGLTVAEMQSPFGSAKVAQHGGQVLEYTPTDQRPVLWLSDRAAFAPGKAIRGGIPVCWPWFGPHPEDSKLPAHGFARNALWDVISTNSDDSISITLGLKQSEQTPSAWPHSFELSIQVSLASSLEVALTARNTGALPMTCSAALHSYFAMSNISNIRITGLEGTEYRDQLDCDKIKSDKSPITFDREVDRVYHDTTGECLVEDPGWNRSIRIAKAGSRSTVVWNPWIAKAARMEDFGDEEYRAMVCVETTNADDDTITIPPGEKHTLTAIISSSSA